MKIFWKRHLDKFGLIGSLFSVLCCIGAPAIISFVFVIGLGFLINDVILFPLLIFFLISSLIGLFFGMCDHGYPWAFVIGILSALITLFFIAISFNKALAIIGITGLIIASLINFLFQSKKKNSY